jgi:glycerol dehydrogenase-like iron-containing ADH family enzyme
MNLSLEETIKYNKSGPARYCNRINVWEELDKLLLPYGKRAIVSGGAKSRKSLEGKLFPALEKAGIRYEVNPFTGESSMENVNKLLKLCEEYKPDYIIGTGGGKSLDTAKYAAVLFGVPIIAIPTIAATCAASSNQIIVYSDSGEYLENIYPQTNPELVIVDPDIIAKAPEKYMISGIFDSLAKWYEGSASLPGSKNADIFDDMALALARMLKDKLMSYSRDALYAVRDKEVTKHFIHTINLNVYTAAAVQALGIKAVRNGIAHSTQNGITALEGSHDITHGEKVAYGIAVQLILLDSPQEEQEEFFDFCGQLGFNPAFKGMGLDFNEENIRTVAQKAVSDVLMKKPPFDNITCEMMVSAVRKLESLR